MNLSNPNLLQTKSYIDGKWIETTSTFEVKNPANFELIANVTNCSEKEVIQAIESANTTFKTFKKTLAKERSQYLRRMSELMLHYKNDLATILTSEQGKPYAEAVGEVVYAASFYEWFAEEAKRVYGDIIPSHKPNSKILVTKEAVGVVAAITPWNFPLAMFTRKAGAAIAAGCTVIWKPSKETPLSALALAKIAEEAGVPKGVINVVCGDSSSRIVNPLMESKLVKKITFTGSTEIGKLLVKQSADTLKKVSMELGGNAPFIVFDDADIDLAVAGLMASKFRNTGQTCVCVNRIYVHDKIYQEFTDKLATAINSLKVADGFTDGATQGPLINKNALQKVMNHVEDAINKGGVVKCGGKPHELGGNFYYPTLIVEANNQMMVATDETFGPLAVCFRFKTEEEVIELANSTDFGWHISIVVI